MIQPCIFADEVSRNFEEAVDLCARAGVHNIELRRGIGGRSVTECTDDEVARMKEILARYESRVVCIGSPVGKCDIYDDAQCRRHVQWFDKMCRLADSFGTRIIRGFAFHNPNGQQPGAQRPDIDRLLPRMVDKLSPIVQKAEKEGVYFCLESEPTTCSGTCSEIAKIIDGLGGSPNLAVAWDIYNAAELGEDPLAEGYPKIRGRVRHLHIKPNKYKNIETVNETAVSYEQIMRLLLDDGYQGAASIEHWGSRWLMLEGARQLVELLDSIQAA